MITFTVTAVVSIFAPAKRPTALHVVPSIAKRRDQAGVTDSVEEDDRGSGGEAMAGDLK